MKLNGIEFGGRFGGHKIINQPADKMPQDLASAIGVINSLNYGATYEPIWYVSNQLVNGMNHVLICKELRSTKDFDTMIVGLIVNIPPGSVDGKGAKIVEIIEEAKLDEEVRIAFNDARKQLLGNEYKAILHMGNQVVRGMNYYIVCQAKGNYSNAQPYAVMLVVNSFSGVNTVVAVERIEP